MIQDVAVTSVRAGRVQGKVALISGAARGQGASHARRLAAEGASVLVTDVLDDLGRDVVESISANGGSAVYQHLDVRSSTDWSSAVAAAESRFGKLDILCNNAGIVAVAGVEECSDEEWADVIAVNQTGPFQGTRAAIPAFRRAGGGAIVNTSSVYGLKGVWGYAAYCASKAAVIALTKSTAKQYGCENIRANAICPGVVDTPMLAAEIEIFDADPHFDYQAFLNDIPISRAARPDEISELVLFLASDDSAYSTGAVHTIDGGLIT